MPYIFLHPNACGEMPAKKISKRRKSESYTLCQYETSWLSSAASNSFMAKPKLPGSDIDEHTKMTKHISDISVQPLTLVACFLFAIHGCQVSTFAFQLETHSGRIVRTIILFTVGCLWQPMCQAATCASIVQRSSFFTVPDVTMDLRTRKHAGCRPQATHWGCKMGSEQDVAE